MAAHRCFTLRLRSFLLISTVPVAFSVAFHADKGDWQGPAGPALQDRPVSWFVSPPTVCKLGCGETGAWETASAAVTRSRFSGGSMP